MRKFSIISIVLVVVAAGLSAHTQETGQLSTEGDWNGTAEVGPNNTAPFWLHLEKAPDGLYFGWMNQGSPADVNAVKGVELRGDILVLTAGSFRFEGKLNAAATEIAGVLRRLGSQSGNIVFQRMDPAKGGGPRLETLPSGPPGLQLGLDVKAPPTPLRARGKTHLIYELSIENFRWFDTRIERLEVLDGDQTLLSLDGYNLDATLTRPRILVGGDHRVIPAGGRAVTFLWVTLDGGRPAPAKLSHRLTVEGRSVTGGPTAVLPAPALALGPPLRGSNWRAVNGPNNDLTSHRRAYIVVNGEPFIAQRFAIDWLKIGPNGATSTGSENKDYFSYSQDVLAVADGVVVEVKDGISENIPGRAPTPAASPEAALQAAAGNHVILDLGDGRFATFGHLQPGKLRVKVGDRVRKGDILGLVGNSGNSTAPHLHFHVSNRPSALAAEGMPYVLESFEVLSGADAGLHMNEIPLAGDLIRFATGTR